MQRATRQAFRRVRRQLNLWFFLPAAGLFVLRIVWGYSADNRLARLREELHAAGLKVYPKDYPPHRTLQDKDNAVAALADALQALPYSLSSNSPFRMNAAGAIDPERTHQESAAILADFAASSAALPLIDDAGTRPQISWPAAPNRYYFFSKPRSLISLLCETALVQHAQGHDADALLQLHRSLIVTHILLQQPSLDSLRTLVAGTSYSRNVLNATAECLIPQLHLDTPTAQAEARQILLLLQEEPPSADLATQATMLEYFEEDTQRRISLPWLMAPLGVDQKARAIRILTRQLPALRAESFPQATVLLVPPRGRADQSLLIQLDDNIGYIKNAQYVPVVLTLDECQFRANYRSLALLLAAQLYASTHGHLPLTAEQLVPEFLPRLPQDPFTTPPQPLHYRVDAAGPIAWSVGRDGLDDTTGHPLAAESKDLVYGSVRYPQARP